VQNKRKVGAGETAAADEKQMESGREAAQTNHDADYHGGMVSNPPAAGLPSSRRFGGLDRLYGPGTVARLAAVHVTVIGIGGVGSWAVEALARSGVGRLTLIDLDHVAESNMNRQIHAVEDALGAAKVQVMRNRVLSINPACIVDCSEEFIDAENLGRLVPECDAVLDAIDNVRAKAALIAHCRAHKLPLVTTGGAGGRLDPTRTEVDDLARTIEDPLASKVRARLRKEYGFPRDPKKKFGVECVYSREPLRRPENAANAENPEKPGRRAASADFYAEESDTSCAIDGSAGLACAGYGSSVAVTAAFGFAAASRVLALCLAGILPRQ
jgi:tRNA A37 threonylcarbamoyladenosine dehydratase